jgi:oligopeptide transport system substrate-binding protein
MAMQGPAAASVREGVLYAILPGSGPLILGADNGSLCGRTGVVPGASVNILRIVNPPKILFLLGVLSLAACDATWNNPYPAADNLKNIYYSSFDIRPKHLDPAQSYASNEVVFTGQIYEPPLQYHYLKRPYQLIPLAAEQVPVPYFEDAAGRRLPADTPPAQIAYSVYEIHIRPGIRYQPHPAFAKDAQGRPRYLNLRRADLEHIETLSDFADTGSRELVAADYIYEIKRLAHPRLHSPIFGLMAEYIVGLRDYAKTLRSALEQQLQADPENTYLDLRQYPLAGVEEVDRYTYRIKIRGEYPQFRFWLAMNFFAPVPPEADRFYQQPGMKEKNITLDWYPVGTGPYLLSVNNPNRQMVLERNPNFHGERYPSEGEPGDAKLGLLRDAGKPMPFIDRVVFSLEKETIPSWNKFLQGYYDASGISSDSFDQAIQVSSQGDVGLTESMRQKGIRLLTGVATSNFYMGFNMKDPVVGGYTPQARKLRQAISIAIDYEEFISIFLNGRGIPAQGPLPPGIFGYVGGREGINPYVYDWVDGEPRRKPIAEAKRLLTEAGYPDGRDANSGKPLIIHLDTTGGGPDDKAQMDWLRKQFAKIDLQLEIRATDYNRFQEKMLKGTEQLFQWGWNADYPDPENFLFLLYGPNAKVGKNGENAANYENPEFDRLFQRMTNMANGPRRLALIQHMTTLVQRDAPWAWGFNPKQFSLFHNWVYNVKPNFMANNTLKYKRIDPVLRNKLRTQWNRPVLWPLVLLGLVFVAALLPAVVTYRRKLRAKGVN